MTANSHLSDNEFAELLAGNTSQTVLAHLQACPECGLEARELREAIIRFRESLDTAAAVPATQLGSEPQRSRWSHARRGWVLRAAGALAIVLMGVGAFVLDRNSTSVEVSSPAPVNDTELLNQVQTELSSDAPAALEPAAYIADYIGEDRQQILSPKTGESHKQRSQ